VASCRRNATPLIARPRALTPRAVSGILYLQIIAILHQVS
jgi:hypothetical protein